MYAWQFAKLQYCAVANGWAEFATMQNRYNLVNREDERDLIPLCADMGVGLIPYSPLARGLLAGTRQRSGAREPNGPPYPAVTDSRTSPSKTPSVTSPGASMSQWHAWRSPGCSAKSAVCAPIVGATKEAHMRDAMASLDLNLSENDLARVESPYVPRLLSDF